MKEGISGGLTSASSYKHLAAASSFPLSGTRERIIRTKVRILVTRDIVD